MMSGNDRQMAGVDRGDNQETYDVVDDGEREYEAAQSFGSVPAQQGEQAKGEGGVGRHGRPPAVRGRAPGVDRQVEPDRGRHPAESRQHGKDDPGSLPELADVQVPPSPSSPTTRKKKLMSPLLTQWSRRGSGESAASTDVARTGGSARSARRRIVYGRWPRMKRSRPQPRRAALAVLDGLQETPEGGVSL